MAERKYDLYSHDAKANIHAVHAQMRAENPLICQAGLDGETMIWFVTGYDEAEAILRDDRHFVREPRNALGHEPYEMNDLDRMLSSHMLNKDWDDHRRLRNLVSKAFTPRIVRQLEPRVQAIADELLDAVAAQGEMDLVADFAFHLPTIVISELLGVPAEARDKFRVWANAAVMPAMDEASMAESMRHLQEFFAFLQAFFAERRVNPRDDLTSALIQAEEDGDRLSEQELFSMLFLLIVAGHETTVSLIGNAMVALWQHPDQLALLKEKPELMKTAVEELLRYDGPVERTFNRWATEDIEIGGETLPKGSIIIPIISAANRDPRKFENPEQLDITRQVNAHMAFGKGVHYCVGAPLARMEAEIALSTLLRRLPDMQPAVPLEQLRWRLTPMFRSLEALPVRWEGNLPK